jgi:hypothetical protein
MSTVVPFTIRATKNKKDVMARYKELKKDPIVDRVVVLAQLKDGSFHIFGQAPSQPILAALIMQGARAIAKSYEDQAIEMATPPAPRPPVGRPVSRR